MTHHDFDMPAGTSRGGGRTPPPHTCISNQIGSCDTVSVTRPPHRPCAGLNQSRCGAGRLIPPLSPGPVTMGFRVASVPTPGIIVADYLAMISWRLKSAAVQARMAIETEIVPIPRVRHSSKGTISFYARWMLIIRDPITEDYSEEFYRTRKAATMRRNQLLANGSP